ncbi:nuclear transport factor 2 family protein [Brooklawnia cerclae]|uniref:Ketosteroid isomerase-like protein n=1 Tax=Brooklawnia cerclae TaxID=349934 RepID=A0ABX0SIC3_9ACTN|nr:nuclear transport factor 2 family protein [Brooklawnia cerclae]NIH57721.1 ketosteroid isomerase-like protein [Brooklawnia cerclae]
MTDEPSPAHVPGPCRAVEALQEFFAAENARDWDAYAGFLAPDVEWSVISPGIVTVVRGIEDYLAAMKRAYLGSDGTFVVRQVSPDASGRIVSTVLEDDEGNRSLDVFEFRDGLIAREWEFLLGVDPFSQPTR